MPHHQERTVDFFSEDALPAPRVSPTEAERIAAQELGFDGRAQALGSNQDVNFLLRERNGAGTAILKIANPSFSSVEIDAQDAAADLVASACPDLRVATVLRHPDGTPRRATVATESGPVIARLLRYLPGGALTGSQHLSPDTVAGMGAIAGQAGAALRDFAHPGLERVLQWDLQHANRVVARLADHIDDAEPRNAVRSASSDAWARVQKLAPELPSQAGHFDLTDDNLIRSPESRTPIPDGVIDFGDLTTSWAVGELASTLTSMLHHDGMEPHHLLPAVRAFHAVRPLSQPEAEALWPLVVLRACVLMVSGRHQVAVDPDNVYAQANLDGEWRMFEAATRLPVPVMIHLVKEATGLTDAGAPADAPVRPLLRDVDADRITVLDLSTDADAMDHGAWLETRTEDRLAASALDAGSTAVATRYAQARLTRATPLSFDSTATVPTGIDLWLGRDTLLQAPAAGTVLASEPGLVEITYGPRLLTVSLPAASSASVLTGSQVQPGDVLAQLPSRTSLRLTLRDTDSPAVPSLVRPEYAEGWLALTADPAPLLGLPATGPTAPDGLLERRDAAFATAQKHYYANPPRMERGWRHFMLSTDGRAYLDMVNNVTPLGHAHPRVEEVVARQLRRLNTNSRFHYAAVVEFTERLAALLPDPLDTVFLVNSGSEAVDLGLQLARGASGLDDVVAVREAYHGWTYASDAVTTSLVDYPNGLASRPEWVHTVDSPNSFRGRHRGAAAAQYAPEAVTAIDELAASGRPAGAFISETFYGNAGGVALPDGYLSEVYAAVRRHGGLVIADEVQVGYGRLGHWFWGFEQQQVVPDIVCVAKATGNGHPLGAVITSQAVADRYRDNGGFFSSTGGSPVSSVVGLTVLDTLRDEGLQENAVRVGGHLGRRLGALADRYDIIGAVHGSGLYLGLELVRDRDSLKPATEETAELCDRMLDLGVIVQPTGDHLNILKIKPPLCIDRAAADFFIDTLDRALAQLGHAR
ncbi:aminotransferase [Streptomyces sp. NPDC021212]|uniref:aminotransferase n=1 Tax=Streptomyces sp. NPDC021212 TaxID=3365118 RepID=UPI003795AE07